LNSLIIDGRLSVIRKLFNGFQEFITAHCGSSGSSGSSYNKAIQNSTRNKRRDLSNRYGSA
jgi:hypothetical protein